jgi:hypothetical protein
MFTTPRDNCKLESSCHTWRGGNSSLDMNHHVEPKCNYVTFSHNLCLDFLQSCAKGRFIM